jgi:hypothetical protein
MRLTADRPIEGLRQRRCCDPACNTVFTICASCDQGQRYCSEGCRKRTRQQQLRASGRKYQASTAGRHNLSQRQQSNRRRRCQPCVTHQGPALIATQLPPRPASLSRWAVCGHENRWINRFDGFGCRRPSSRKRPRSGQDPRIYAATRARDVQLGKTTVNWKQRTLRFLAPRSGD